MSDQQLSGTIAIVQSPDGYVHGVGQSFDLAHAGFSREDWQDMKARERAWSDVFQKNCHADVARAISASGQTRTVSGRMTVDGWRVTVRKMILDVPSSEQGAP